MDSELLRIVASGKQCVRDVEYFGYACGLGAADQGCRYGPARLAAALGRPLTLLQVDNGEPYAAIAQINRRLADAVSDSLARQHRPVVIGGDHSCALGTWAGVYSRFGAIPLLWIDAHLDSHTPQTSPSGNIHGMPLAALLGYGDKALTTLIDTAPKLRAQNVCVFGVRSFEPQEHALLQALGVKVIYAADIMRNGLLESLRTALYHVKGQGPFGISIDLDAFDPAVMQGVGSPEPNGIDVANFVEVLGLLAADLKDLCALEIAEYNPQRDRNGETAQWTHRILKQLVH